MMTAKSLTGLLGVSLALALSPQAAVADAPGFDEVYGLVRSNLVGVTTQDLDQSALRGLLEQLNGRAILATNLPNTDFKTVKVERSSVYEDSFAYLRLQNIDAGAAEAFSSVFNDLKAKNKLQGIVLDLRFAQGQDYAAAAALADLFIAEGQAILEAGDQRYMATQKKDAIALPVIVLVNRLTAGGPEAVAAMLRQANVALVLGGTNTAGQAYLFKDYPLSNGQTLKLARIPVKLPKGNGLADGGVKPDITIPVSLADERLYFEDAYRVLPGAVAQTSTARRLTEAELVRQHRESGGGGEAPPVEAAPSTPKLTVRDPALGRALDLLKGLAVVKKLQAR